MCKSIRLALSPDTFSFSELLKYNIVILWCDVPSLFSSIGVDSLIVLKLIIIYHSTITKHNLHNLSKHSNSDRYLFDKRYLIVELFIIIPQMFSDEKKKLSFLYMSYNAAIVNIHVINTTCLIIPYTIYLITHMGCLL